MILIGMSFVSERHFITKYYKSTFFHVRFYFRKFYDRGKFVTFLSLRIDNFHNSYTIKFKDISFQLYSAKLNLCENVLKHKSRN